MAYHVAEKGLCLEPPLCTRKRNQIFHICRDTEVFLDAASKKMSGYSSSCYVIRFVTQSFFFAVIKTS